MLVVSTSLMTGGIRERERETRPQAWILQTLPRCEAWVGLLLIKG